MNNITFEIVQIYCSRCIRTGKQEHARMFDYMWSRYLAELPRHI